MIKKDLILLTKYIFIFLFLIFSPLILYIFIIKREANIFILGPTALICNIIVSLIVPYAEIKLCQCIAKQNVDTMLIKLLSTKKVPVIVLLFLVLLDIALPISFVRLNNWLSSVLLFYTSIISFSGSFLPIFIMSADYKNILSKNIPEFYDESNNFITIFIITIFTFGCKLIGMGIFMPLHVEIHNFFVR